MDRLHHANPTQNDQEIMTSLVRREKPGRRGLFSIWYNQIVPLCSLAYVFTCREKCDILGYIGKPNL